MLNVDNLIFSQYVAREPNLMATQVMNPFQLEDRKGKCGDYVIRYFDGTYDIYVKNEFSGLYKET